MSLVEKIKTVATSAQSKQVFLDLACLMIYADKKAGLPEQEIIKKVLKMEAQPGERLEHYYKTTMAKMNRNDFNVDDFLSQLGQKFESTKIKEVAIVVAEQLMTGSKEVSPKTEAVFEKIRQTLRT